jgi:branched-chain amino acid aminotransferase
MTGINQKEGLIWLNGEFVDWKDANVHILTHALHYASSVFEGERCYNGVVFKMREHHERLLQSAKIMDLPVKYTVEELDDIVMQTIEKNNLRDCYIRPLIWRGSEDCGVYSRKASVNLMVAAWVWKSYFDENSLEKGVKLCWGDWVRPDPASAPIAAKASCLYAIGTLCKNRAHDKGFDDALLFDYRKYVAESTGSNAFFVFNGEIHTPIPHAFLNGITRQMIIEIAKRKGYVVLERDIFPREIFKADEAFLTGTAAEVMPIGKIEDKIFKYGPVTRDLRAAYLNLVNGGR